MPLHPPLIAAGFPQCPISGTQWAIYEFTTPVTSRQGGSLSHGHHAVLVHLDVRFLKAENVTPRKVSTLGWFGTRSMKMSSQLLSTGTLCATRSQCSHSTNSGVTTSLVTHHLNRLNNSSKPTEANEVSPTQHMTFRTVLIIGQNPKGSRSTDLVGLLNQLLEAHGPECTVSSLVAQSNGQLKSLGQKMASASSFVHTNRRTQTQRTRTVRTVASATTVLPTLSSYSQFTND